MLGDLGLLVHQLLDTEAYQSLLEVRRVLQAQGEDPAVLVRALVDGVRGVRQRLVGINDLARSFPFDGELPFDLPVSLCPAPELINGSGQW